MRKHHSRHRVARVLVGIAGALAGTATLSFTGPTPVGADQSPSYWMAHSGGHVDAEGGAPSLGSDTPDPGAAVVDVVTLPDGTGYWLAESDGRVAAEGHAASLGSAQGKPLSHPVVGMAATPDDNGYWLVASDGGVFSFGDAAFFGSTGAERLSKPIIGMASTRDGRGYWLVASDGGVFTFGDAGFHGSAAGQSPGAPATGLAPTPDGAGYWVYTADGHVFAYGDAASLGSGAPGPSGAPVDAMVVAGNGVGYWLIDGAGAIRGFGLDGPTPSSPFAAMAETALPAQYFPPPPPPPPTVAQKAEHFALGQVGKPYSYGAIGMASYDCSGLVYRSFLEQGLTLPRTAAGQYGAGPHFPLAQAQPGDLVFWSSGRSIYHVGIYVGNGQVVNATHSGSTVQVMAIGAVGPAVPQVTRV